MTALHMIAPSLSHLVANPGKGGLGENAPNVLGALITTSLQLAAMSRANIPEADRRDFSIIIDEFQNYATPSIATFLSEARKYRTQLILANQFTQQIPDEILAAILGNVGNQIIFQLGVSDAELLKPQLSEFVTINDLTSIPKYHCYCVLLLDGTPRLSFSIKNEGEVTKSL